MDKKTIGSYIGKAEAKPMNTEQKPSDPIEEALKFSAEVAADGIKKDAVAGASADQAAKRAEAELRRLRAEQEARRLQAEGAPREPQVSVAERAIKLLEAGIPPEQVGQLLLNGDKQVAPGVGFGTGGMHFDLTMLVKYLMDQANTAQNAALKADIELLKSRQPSGITKEDLQEILKVFQAQSSPLAIAQTMVQFKEALQAIGIGGGQQDNSDLGVITRFNQLRAALGQSGLIPQAGSTEPSPALIQLKQLEWQHNMDMANLKAQQEHRERVSLAIQNIPARIGSALARGITEGQQERAATPAPAFNIEATVGEMGQAQCPACGGPIAVVPELQGGRCPKCQTPFTVTRIAPQASSQPAQPE